MKTAEMVTIQTDKGPQAVEAYRYGCYAVHVVHGILDGEERDAYRVTHLPSGRAFPLAFNRAAATALALLMANDATTADGDSVDAIGILYRDVVGGFENPLDVVYVDDDHEVSS